MEEEWQKQQQEKRDAIQAMIARDEAEERWKGVRAAAIVCGFFLAVILAGAIALLHHLVHQ
jgi:hypothetical protein